MQRKPPILGKVVLIRTQSWSLRYNADNTGQICEQPEDLQLAQELPSGRVKLLTPVVMAVALDKVLRLPFKMNLAPDPRAHTPPHRSLYKLLC